MFDIIIKGGSIIDGSGKPSYKGDVGISGERIIAVGDIGSPVSGHVIDASDRVICPGFIDTHTHSDVMLLANPTHETKIKQGITTELLGQDGLSYAPLSDENIKMMRCYLAGLNGNPNIDWNWNTVSQYLGKFDRKVAVNVSYLVPHNALRLETIGFVDRTATKAELKKMQEIVAKGMYEGAVGFSTGLDYFPARYSTIEELIAICKTVAEHDGISVWHWRRMDLGLIGAIQEILKIGEETNVKIHISHFKAWSKNPEEIVSMIDNAREKGIDVTFDSYPYIAGSTFLARLLPNWVFEGGPDAILERLGDLETKEKICSELNETVPNWEKYILCHVSTSKNKKYIGQNFLQASQMAKQQPAEFYCNLLLEEGLDANYMGFSGSEEEIQEVMKHPCHTVCSDGLLVGDKPNPRAYGAFPRFIGVYARDLGLLSIEEMIRHMTSSPARRIGLKDRGLVKEGLAADLVIFDPKTIKDKATFEEPKQYPQGIEFVFVNGAITVEKGKHTGALNGKSLLKCYTNHQ